MDSFAFSSDSNSSFIIKESTTDTNRGDVEDGDNDVSITLLSNDELSRVENEVVIIDTHRASVNNVTIDHNYESNNCVLPDVFVVTVKKDVEDNNSNIKCDVKTPLLVRDNTSIVLTDNISRNYVDEQPKGSSSSEIADNKLNRSNIGLSNVQHSCNNYLNEVIEIKDEPNDIVLNDDEEISASEFTDFIQEELGERKEKQDEKKSNDKFYAIDFCDVTLQEKSKPKSFQSLSITGVKKIEITKNKQNFLVNYPQNSDFFLHNNPGMQFKLSKNVKNDNCLMSFNRKNIWKYFTKLPLSKVKCNLCLKIFFYYNRTSYLLRHLHIKHKNYFSLNNKKFKKSYEKISTSLQKYFIKYSGRVKCNICFKLFFNTHNTNSILRNHIMSKHKNVYSQTSVHITPTETSVSDGHSLNIKSELNENQSVRSSSETNKMKKISLIWEYFTKLNRGKVKCNLCCTLFSCTRSSLSDLRQHLILKHNDVYDNIIKIINNENAEYNKTNTSKTWQYYTKLDYNEVKCNICLQVLTYHNNTSNLLRHLRFKHGIIFGNFKQNDSNNTSSNSFSSSDSSEMIYKKFGEVRPSRTWKYFTKICLDKVRCNICYKILSYVRGVSSNLTRHLNTMHANVYRENNVKIETRSTPNQRDKRLQIKCDKVQKINLTWKYFTKVRPNKAKCNLCPHINILSYSKNCVISNLTRHLERKHKTVIESVCIKSMEGKDKKHSLQPSGYNYINSDDSIKINIKFLFNCLKQNEKLKSSIKFESGNIKCSVCSKTFLCTSLKDYEYSLVQHIQIYHAKWEVMCTSNSIIEYQNDTSISSNYNELEAIANEIQSYIKEESVHNETNGQGKIDNKDFGNKTYDNVWKYFTRITSENVRCNYCFILLSYRKNKKWNLYRHLKLKHKAKFYESNSMENKSHSIKSKSKFNEKDSLLENKMNNYKRKTKFNENDFLPENKNPNVKKKVKYNDGNENDSSVNKNYSIKNKTDSSPKVKILPDSQDISGKSKNNVTSNKTDKSKENKQIPVTPLGNRKIGRTWSHFTKIEMGVADCNICHDILSYSSNGTDILNNHLNKKHKDYFSKSNATNIDDSNFEIKEQQSVKNKVKYNSDTSVRDGVEIDKDDDFNKKGNVTPESNDKKKRNKVWTYYTELGNSHAKCHLCLSQISYKSSVDNLTHHLQRIHSVISLPDPVPKTDDVEEEKSQLFAAIDLTPNPSPESKSKTQVCFTKISKNIAKCNFCFKIIPYKNGNIQKLMNHLHSMHLTDVMNYSNLLFRNSSNFIDINEFRSSSISEQKSQNISLTSLIDSGQKSDIPYPKRRRSDTWLYYTKINNHYAKCNICNNYLSYKGGSIYNLTRHLFIKHNIKFVKRLSTSLYNSKTTKLKTFNKIPKMFNIYKKKSETLSFYKKINRYLVKCKLCSKPFTYKGVNINRLINHLWSVHITKLIGFDEPQNQNLLNVDNDDPNKDNYKEVNVSGVMSNDSCVNDKDHSHDFLCQDETTTYNKETGRKISNAWKYFTKSTDSKAKCNICLRFLSFKSGNISNLSRHLERNHEIKFFKNKSGVIKSKNDKKINFNDETKSLYMNGNIKKKEVLDDVPVTVLCNQEKNKQKITNNYIWKYFMNISDEKVKCKICHENISYEGKVSSLCDHVSLKHKIKIIPHDRILSTVKNITDDESVNVNSLNDMKVFGSLTNNTDRIIIKKKKLMSHVIKMKCKLCYKYFVSKRRESEKLFEHLKIHENQLRDDDYLQLKQFFNTKKNLTKGNVEENSNSFNIVESVGSKKEVISINETFLKEKLILKYFKNLNSFKNKCKICYRYVSDKIHCYHHINNDILIKYGVKRSKSLRGIDKSSVKIKNNFDSPVEMLLKDKKLKTLKSLKMKHFVNVNLSMPSKCLCNTLTQNNGYCSHTLKRWLNENNDETNLKSIKSFDDNNEPIPSKDEIELLTNSLDEYNENKIIIITDNNDTSILQCSDINRSEEITDDISYHIMNSGNEIDDDIKVIIYNFNSEEVVESSSQITSGGSAGEIEEMSQTSNQNQSSNRTLDEHIKVLLKEINNSTKISSSNLSKDSLNVTEEPCNLGEEISSRQSESLSKDEEVCVEGSSSKKCDSSEVQEQMLSDSFKIPINQLSENNKEDPNNLDKIAKKSINLSGNLDSVQLIKNDLNSVQLVVEKPGSDLEKTGKSIDNCIKVFSNSDANQNIVEITDEVLVSNTSSDESKALIKDEKAVNHVISSNTSGRDLIDVIFDNVVVTLEESSNKDLNFLNCLSDNFYLKSGKYLQNLSGLHKINKNLIFFSSIDYEYNTAKCNICDDYLIFKTPIIYHLMTHLYLKHKDSLLKEKIVKNITDSNIERDFNSFTCDNDDASRATVTVATVPSRPRKKSPVWKYFVNDKNYRATCRVCNFNFSYKGGAVNNLARHLRLRHGIIVSSRNEKGESIDNNDDVEQLLMNFPIVPKRRTCVKLRSKTWFYFTKEPNDWARCNICKKYLSYRSSTINNLTRHLRTVHPNAFNSLFTNKGCSTMNDYNNCKEDENGIAELNDDVYNAILSEVSTRSRDEILQECSYASDRSNSKRKSVVWNYFTELSRNSGKCNFCSKIISCKGGGTSNLSRHLRVKHGVWIVMTSSLSQSFHEMQQSITNDEIVDNDETNFIRDDNRGSLEINTDNDKIITHEHLHILKTRKLTAPNKKSKIWNYFTKENEDRVICNLCSKPLSYKCRAVHNLRRHLTIKHPTYVVKPEPVRLKLQINPESDEVSNIGQDGSIDDSKRFIDITDTSVVIVDEENPVPPRRPDRSTRPKKSIVWNYFEEVEYGIAKCFMCSKVLSFRGGGTNNLMRHLRCRHSIIIVSQPNSDLQSNGDTTDSVVDTIDNDDSVNNNPNYIEQVS